MTCGSRIGQRVGSRTIEPIDLGDLGIGEPAEICWIDIDTTKALSLGRVHHGISEGFALVMALFHLRHVGEVGF